jgi:phosphohistidine swiveling domain-containing protein
MGRRSHLDTGAERSSDEPVVIPDAPPVLDLDDAQATTATVTGAKAAALARARLVGLPVLPGFAVTVDGASSGLDAPELHAAWRRLSDDGSRALAVRSSSTVEDSSTTSMAGHFTSVLDVRGWDGFVDAVHEVLATAGDDPMAVLVQPMLDARLGGVLFGIDPISGRHDRVLVEVVHGGPVSLVSGGVVARSHVLTTHGRLVDMTVGEGPKLTVRQRRELAHLAASTAKAFDGPQDVEWAIDTNGHLWLLQSRPVTAAGAPGETGPIFGPGPVAETLPDPLSALEEDLWAAPLRDGIRDALITLGTASRRALRRSPVVVSVGGLLAADLRLLGIEGGPKRRLAWLDPRDPARRLAAAWRVGRLRRAMPSLAADVIEAVDAELAAVPPLVRLDDELLLRLLERSSEALHAVHGHEVLAGMLGLEDGGAGATAALAAVARHREAGRDDEEIVAIDPTVLALYPPRIGRAPAFPPVPHAVVALRQAPLAAREALRLRARWLHEVGARAAVEAGRRLVAKRALDDAALVRHLRLAELREVFAGGSVPADLAARSEARLPAPLPAAFRLDAEGRVHAVTTSSGGSRGAGGGRGVGPVHHAADGPPPEGAVLVTRTLDPGLAGVLPGLAGLVSETGSVLSHLAIVARELGVATVVGLPDAGSLRSGTVVVVDGETGEVQPVEARD